MVKTKSGVCQINCKDCNQNYVGEIKRSILTRYKKDSYSYFRNR